jgi:hypothetical protein
MGVEAPTRNIIFPLPMETETVVLEEIKEKTMGFWEYGPIAGRPESSEGYWVPVDWMAWKLLVDILRVSPERLK